MKQKEFSKQTWEKGVAILAKLGLFTDGFQVTDKELEETEVLAKDLASFVKGYREQLEAPKFEVGDYVVSDASNIIAEIDEISDGVAKNEICYDFDTSRIRKNFTGGLGYIRHATSEEIAEYESALNFHNHGRKPFEVKSGDLIKAPNGQNIFTYYPECFSKSDFLNNGFKLLKTADKFEKWLGAEDE